MASITFSENTYEEESSKIITKNILVVGLTGSGKSSIIETLCVPENKKGSAILSFKPVTKNINQYLDNMMTGLDGVTKYNINLFDTVGLGDGKVTVPEILKQIMEVMPKDLSKIHKIVFCFKLDRLRANMSQELTMVYTFFKSLGAKSSNFVMCLTFCDILNNTTIGQFWEELKAYEDLPMTREIGAVTYTSFPNLGECDQDENLLKYLDLKIRQSKARVFQTVIETPEDPIYPHDNLIKMAQMEFEQLCEIFRTYRKKEQTWWRKMFSPQEEQDMILQKIIKVRNQVDRRKENEEKIEQVDTNNKIDSLDK